MLTRRMAAQAIGGGPGRRRRARGRRPALVAVVAVGGLLAVACGGGGSGGGASGSAAPSAAGSPKTGGTLSFVEYATVTGLDPAITIGTGSNGLIETTAIYDTLMRYDFKAGKYEPGTAESATPNADATVWTIKLRPNVKFTDGTPYNAEAVTFGLNRARVGQTGGPPCAEFYACPRPSSGGGQVMSFVKDIKPLDDLTVQVTLTTPMTSFPMALATEPGLIPSPTAIKKDCKDPAAAITQCSFNTAPVGAGPFMVQSYSPGESINLVRNPDYWGGPAYLDGLRFYTLGDGGGLKSLAAVESGQAQAGFLRDQIAVAQAHADKVGGIVDQQYGGSIFMLNSKSPTSGAHNLKVRQAIAAAVDPEVVNQRVFQGKAKATTQLLTSSFLWYPDVPGPKYDPDAAKQLVTQAKAEGWDGKLKITTSNTPMGVNTGLAVQAMLQNVGMNVSVDNTRDTPGVVGLFAQGQYDMLLTGQPVGNDDTAAMGLAQFYMTGSRLVQTAGTSNAQIDAGFKQIFSATTDAEKKAGYATFEKGYNASVPALSLATFEQFIPLSPTVHGVQQDLKTNIHLDKAWLG